MKSKTHQQNFKSNLENPGDTEKHDGAAPEHMDKTTNKCDNTVSLPTTDKFDSNSTCKRDLVVN